MKREIHLFIVTQPAGLIEEKSAKRYLWQRKVLSETDGLVSRCESRPTGSDGFPITSNLGYDSIGEGSEQSKSVCQTNLGKVSHIRLLTLIIQRWYHIATILEVVPSDHELIPVGEKYESWHPRWYVRFAL